ncbi:beta-galactosidase 13-like [Senna tora]|uniref:Beta-galactosidase n=1 Tax=Senna tora TaxID=362788 RepID=A0A834W731_9FABA|nr:beta-galactosidase 13-like [Senna tora]
MSRNHTSVIQKLLSLKYGILWLDLLKIWENNFFFGRNGVALAEYKNVTYDGKSLLINGKRELLYSGSIHYTRSTPEMWPDLLKKARYGGLNVIQTYVFWNAHEPEKGKYNFEGNYDLVKFLKLVQENGMYVNLRFGPFIQAEWNHGGLPYWLREVPDIIFRSDNEPFKFYMKKFVTMVVDMMKAEKMFANQGGPIILAQIENEYNHVQRAYRERGDTYVQWAANLAVSFDAGVPWIMCKQTDAPDPVINACNGRHCGDTFEGPNKPYKPALWTENWTAQFRVFGDPPSQRSAEDTAFSIVRFFSKSGSLVNYYMYHGGTNFGRTSAAFTTTRYYDEAPLDEYGLQREPKWGHLRDAHKAVNLCKKAILSGTPSVTRVDEEIEFRVFEKPGSDLCAAFLTNNHTINEATVNFRGQKYVLPPRSISVLPDCKTVVFNTDRIASQHNSRNFKRSQTANNNKWEVFTETIPTTKEVPVNQKVPQELFNLLKDTTDYGWYTTSFVLSPEDLPRKEDAAPILRVTSFGHSMLAFVNGEFVGNAHGTHEQQSFELERTAKFKVGINHITLLAATVGLPDGGAYMEHRFAGPSSVTILGLNTGTIDLTINGWGHKVGISGEELGIFTEQGSKTVQWKQVNGPQPALSWYKSKFDAPEGRDPVAIRMTGMGKGMIWINGKSIGRHWMSFLSPAGEPTQSEYHIPRAWLKPEDNLIVVLEEEPASPDGIEIVTVDRDTICSFITENHSPNVRSFDSEKKQFPAGVMRGALLNCPNYKKITAVEFASFGNPTGFCGDYQMGNCSVAATKQIVEQRCLGKGSCNVPMDPAIFLKNGDACPDVMKALAIQVKCSLA